MRDKDFYQRVIDSRKRVQGTSIAGLILLNGERMALADLLRVYGDLLRALADQYQAIQYEALRACEKDRLDGVRGRIDAMDEFMEMLRVTVQPKEPVDVE